MDIETVKTIVGRYKELLKEKYLKYDDIVFEEILYRIKNNEIMNIATNSQKYVNNFYTIENKNTLVVIEKSKILKLFNYSPLVLFYSNIMAKTINETIKNFENNKTCNCKGVAMLSKLTLDICYPKYDWFFDEMQLKLKRSEVLIYLGNKHFWFSHLPIIQDDNHYYILFPESIFPSNDEDSSSIDEESQEDELDKDIKTLEKMIEADVKN